MLAIKECLIREGVLNLTSTNNHHGSSNNTASNSFTAATSGNGCGDTALNVDSVGVGVGVGGVASTSTNAGANNINNIYRNNYNGGSAASSNNLRAISANYTYNSGNNNSNINNNDNRNNRNYDLASVLALADTPQLVASLRDQKKSVDTTHCVNTNNENQSSNCSLSSISATAKSSCQITSKYYDSSKQQQQLQQKQLQEKQELKLKQKQLQELQQKQQQQNIKSKQTQQTAGTNKSNTRYHGVHPHFHHHTAPAYYTDVNLHIHTPKPNDGAALNENYQSVYNTPSHLVNEHYFPKTSTATVVPPPIGTGTAVIGRANTTSPAATTGYKRERERQYHKNQQPTERAETAGEQHSSAAAAARAAFFRGGSAGNNERKSCVPFVKTTSPAVFGRATETGDFDYLNDTKTSYDVNTSHDDNTSYDNNTDDSSSFVVCDILNNTSSDCSKIKQLDNTIDNTSYNTNTNNNNNNNNNHIPITSPTSTGNTSPGVATGASPTTGNTSTSTGRSRHSNRFASKKRAVRVRSESRPISALYDIICKEKGLDIGTSATSDEDSSLADSNDIENYSGGANTNANKNNHKHKGSKRSSKERSRSSKERSQRSNSRQDNLNNDYTEISNCLSAFVANSLGTYLEVGAAGDSAEPKELHTNTSPYKMDNNVSERMKRAHKTRTPSGAQKSGGTKKRKDHGKASSKAAHAQMRSSQNAERYAVSDEEHNGATTEMSEDASARTKLSTRGAKQRATTSSDAPQRHAAAKTNGTTDKASSLPPRLYGGGETAFCQQQQQQQHTASCYLNANGADSYTYAMRSNKCPVHCCCQVEYASEASPNNSIAAQRSSSSTTHHNQNEYHHQSQQPLSLPTPPSLPFQPCSSTSCLRSPITAAENSSAVGSCRFSAEKLYVEPVNLSGMSCGASPSGSAAASISANGSANTKNAQSSSSGVVVVDPSTSSSNTPHSNHQRISRVQQRRLREELRRFTDIPHLDMISPLECEVERAALSEDEGVVAVVAKEGKSRASKARRFINRPSRTPSRGRTGNSVNGSPHPSRRGSTHQHNKNSSESSSSPTSSPPPASNCCCSSTNDKHRISSPTTPPTLALVGGGSVPVSNISLAGVTIEDVGSTSSADHVATLIKLSPLEIMTNSATPATELRPPANGGGVTAPEAELNCVAGGASNGGVQVAISAAEALQQCKYDKHTHKAPANTTASIRTPNTKINTTTITNAINLNNKSATNLKQRSQRQQLQQLERQHGQPQQQHHQTNNHNNSSTSHNNYHTNNKNHNLSNNNSYAMPTETFLLKQKAAGTLAAAANGTSHNSNIPTACMRKKSLSPLVIIPLPSTSPTARATTMSSAHQLSHQHNAHQQQCGGMGVSKLPQRRHSPLLGAQAPLSPYAQQARSPLSPCSPHYVRTTKASRLRAAALDKKKCEEDALYQRARSPTSPRPSTLSPKYQSPRLSTSSSSDNPRITTDSDIKLPAASNAPFPKKVVVSGHQSTSSSTDSPKASKKLIPSLSVSVKQNLSEMHFNGDIKSPSSPRKVILVKPKKKSNTITPDTECTAKFTRSGGRLSTADESDSAALIYSKNGKPLPRPRTTLQKANRAKSLNEVKSSGGDETSSNQHELSSAHGATPDSSIEERDKSSKRKSNLNRSLNDEATADSDDSLAARRRRRRELGMVRQLVPSDDAVVREMLLAHQNKTLEGSKATSGSKPVHNELAYHMEIARRGWDLFTTSATRARSETGSPKYEASTKEPTKSKSADARLARRSDTLHLGELRKMRSNDVNRKVNERTKSDLAEIKKIAEQANVEMAMMATGIAAELAEQAVKSVDLKSDSNGIDQGGCYVELATPARYGLGCRGKPPPAPSYSELEVAAEVKERDSSPAKHATFVQEERIYYDPETSDQVAKSVSNTSMASGLLRQRILKARSMERDAGHEPPKLSPILRRRSTDDPAYITVPASSSTGLHSTSPSATSHNHIVSILKKKDHIATESSSASSNASPVTFSANVVDTPTTKHKRAGILKKRSSLDESRYYSRSHSPDERSILIKSARRNSLEETAGLQQQQQQHGILKQSSYESSKSDGCPSATEPHPHGILKKKDSTSTPSDGGTHAPKHVSISQAVKMAAAELGRETADTQFATSVEYDESGYTPSNEEYEIRPILKLESTSSDDAMRPPKPILKKKSSGDSDEYEIRPILKTSRKSSREEFDLGGSLSEDGRHYSELSQPTPPVRPILKTDSPSKRRSLGSGGGGVDEHDVFNDAENASDSAISLKRRTRSLDRQEAPVVDLAEALNAIATSQAAPVEFVSTPVTTGGSISVAERIRNMEKFLNSAGNSPTSGADANSSWDSPGMTPRLLKPSAIKRDMYRDRYKTQPVTNDEKMLFKATASPLDTSATSAFKPAKSLDIGLNYTTFAHLNAPSAASSTSPGSAFTLTRSSTQPLHPHYQFSAGIGASTVATSTPPLRQINSLSDTPTTTPNTTSGYNNNTYNLSEQLTLSLGSDSERIFEMSGIDDSSLLATTSDVVQSQSEGACSAAGSGGSVVGGSGLSRQNSVRARANMFQQLQEKKKSVDGAAVAATATTAAGLSREGQTSPRRGLPQFSPTSAMLATPPIMSSSLASNDEPNTTPQNPSRADEEIEPTSLPVSERLRFFTNLTEAANRSASNSYTPRSPPQRFLSTDRCCSANSYNYSNSNTFTFTPRSSYNGGSSSAGSSSGSVTPTPMDCCSSPPPLCEPQLISINEIGTALRMETKSINGEGTQSARNVAPTITLTNGTHETSAFIKLTKSSSQTSLPSAVAQRLAMSPGAPAADATSAHVITSASALTPVTRRIKMKTIGKLLLPQTFLSNERNQSKQSNGNCSASVSSNNNTSSSSNDSGVMNGHSDTCDNGGECITINAVSKPPPLKKIGKIKSPFIENCLQMEQKHHQLNTKYMKYDYKSTPHNALAALENNAANGAGGERDVNSVPARKPLQNGNGAPTTPLPTRANENEDNYADAGKENNYCETSNAPLLTLSPPASTTSVTEKTHSPVVEMRKKFARIMNNSTLATMAQRHTAYGLSNGGSNANGNVGSGVGGLGGGGSSSSAPTTPRNSIIDEKFAKYFGLTASNSSHAPWYTPTTTKTNNVSDCEQKVTGAHARLLGAGETRALTRNANKCPPLPPPDFGHAMNGGGIHSAGASNSPLNEETYSTPLEAFNHNVRSNASTPYYTPSTPTSNGAFDSKTMVAASGSALATLSTSVHTVSSGAANALQRRRDMAKRPRANTTNNTFTPTSAQMASPITPYDTPTPTTPSPGRARILRARALTLTNGVPFLEVKRDEDIVVTKEELQAASKEFERIYQYYFNAKQNENKDS